MGPQWNRIGWWRILTFHLTLTYTQRSLCFVWLLKKDILKVSQGVSWCRRMCVCPIGIDQICVTVQTAQINRVLCNGRIQGEGLWRCCLPPVVCLCLGERLPCRRLNHFNLFLLFRATESSYWNTSVGCVRARCDYKSYSLQTCRAKKLSLGLQKPKYDPLCLKLPSVSKLARAQQNQTHVNGSNHLSGRNQ